jgi:peptide/nickel transport system permease protein
MAKESTENLAEIREESKKRGLLAELFVRLVKEKPLGVVGAVIVLILILAAIFADWIAPYGVYDMNLYDRLSPPSAQYLLGTDNLGRDLFSRIVYGARISIYVGIGASIIDVIVAGLIGMVSGYVGGKTDIILQRFVDAWMCFPALVIYLSVMSILGPGLLQVTIVLGISTGIRSSRVVRSAVIGIKQNTYMEAARAIGATNMKILRRHILPNVMAPLIIIFTISVGHKILAEATLSFLGFGVPPPIPSWGGMLSGSGRRYMEGAPWMAIWPGVALASVVYGMNMLGDAVRDILDPRLRGGLGRYGGVKIRKKLGP